eukprot:gnl/TRDRNA2_/TRDRNA2_132353_c0_seq3.p2 gnl/TRDRNA2_/TRDRNA2_132353_c0~~gnl/TRDRNA2_/TRDRNA2_132353_c0_seq3.p2  ORF type:complete len:185 (+),score=40.41 gnl/TRDRNA2_/TRDRNA2_132353_c0_seq3:68-622(+)
MKGGSWGSWGGGGGSGGKDGWGKGDMSGKGGGMNDMEMMMMAMMMSQMGGKGGKDMSGMSGMGMSGMSSGFGKGDGGGKAMAKGPSNINPLKVHVCGLPDNADESAVFATFQKFGEITEMKLMPGTNKQGKRFCFVSYASSESAEACIQSENHVDGTPVDCSPTAAPKHVQVKGSIKGNKWAPY